MADEYNSFNYDFISVWMRSAGNAPFGANDSPIASGSQARLGSTYAESIGSSTPDDSFAQMFGYDFTSGDDGSASVMDELCEQASGSTSNTSPDVQSEALELQKIIEDVNSMPSDVYGVPGSFAHPERGNELRFLDALEEFQTYLLEDPSTSSSLLFTPDNDLLDASFNIQADAGSEIGHGLNRIPSIYVSDGDYSDRQSPAMTEQSVASNADWLKSAYSTYSELPPTSYSSVVSTPALSRRELHSHQRSSSLPSISRHARSSRAARSARHHPYTYGESSSAAGESSHIIPVSSAQAVPSCTAGIVKSETKVESGALESRGDHVDTGTAKHLSPSPPSSRRTRGRPKRSTKKEPSSPKPKIQCSDCDKTFTREADMRRHISYGHKEDNLKERTCVYCGRVASRPDSTRRHKRGCPDRPHQH
ncbi:hypothetical protein HGRIS_004436 [Hohenbuehelia grisea]|uniref:C2H2-type domain-containing protein n=1 Tax=Hohenbuehelia grisea TaxID=104357 RepID=A0ABR3JC94_9AGAR